MIALQSTPFLSICIPTFNRPRHLGNCLSSIYTATQSADQNIEICISDNSTNLLTRDIISQYRNKLNIKYHKHEFNVGIPRNFVKVVSMAQAPFVWLLGDDDLLLNDSIERLFKLITGNPDSILLTGPNATNEMVNYFNEKYKVAAQRINVKVSKNINQDLKSNEYGDTALLFKESMRRWGRFKYV